MASEYNYRNRKFAGTATRVSLGKPSGRYNNYSFFFDGADMETNEPIKGWLNNKQPINVFLNGVREAMDRNEVKSYDGHSLVVKVAVRERSGGGKDNHFYPNAVVIVDDLGVQEDWHPYEAPTNPFLEDEEVSLDDDDDLPY